MKRRTTKELLAESFLELVQTKRIDKITITDITNNCGMSQPTFYNHFKDKYDMIVWIYTNHVREIMCKIDNNASVPLVRGIFCFSIAITDVHKKEIEDLKIYALKRDFL
ncbi:MAG TPA: TetR family transcriptional regulator [Ruminococcus sp.]|nr:TetR family transcriptional regulator [Ruminococcus sp.]